MVDISCLRGNAWLISVIKGEPLQYSGVYNNMVSQVKKKCRKIYFLSMLTVQKWAFLQFCTYVLHALFWNNLIHYSNSGYYLHSKCFALLFKDCIMAIQDTILGQLFALLLPSKMYINAMLVYCHCIEKYIWNDENKEHCKGI